MFSNKPSSVVGCIFTSLWIAASRIILILILLAGTYFVASKVAASFLCESELNLLFNAEQKSLPVSILCGVCTLIAAAVPLAYLYGYDKEKFFKDARILCMDFFILALGIIILLQSDSIEDLVSWMGVPTIFFVIYIVVCYNLFKGQVSKEVNKGSCFGAEVDDTPDGINRGFFYNRTVDNIREALRDLKETGKVWALYGEWGSGKTHLLNHIERILLSESKANDNPEYIFSNINLWQISNREELWKAARSVLEKAYGISSASTWRQKIKDALSSASEVDAKCAIAHTICKDYLKNDDAYNLTHLRDIGKANPNKRFILFIDNLERTDAEVIKELLPLLERLKRLPNLLVIAAVAMQDLIENCKSKNISEELLRGHLIKLTDNVMYMPPMGKEEATSLFERLVEDREKALGFATYLRAYAETVYISFNNLRQVYRAVDVLINLELRYFSEAYKKRNDVHINYSLPFVELVFDVELLRVFYSEAYHALISYCNSNDEIKKVNPPNEYWSKSNLPYENEYLFNAIRTRLAVCDKNEFLLAESMEYANRKNLLPNLCELITYIAYETRACDLCSTIDETINAIYSSGDMSTYIHDVLEYNSLELNKDYADDRALRYASVFFGGIRKIESEYYPSLSLKAILNSFKFLNKTPQLTVESFSYYFEKINFSMAAILTRELLKRLSQKCTVSMTSPREELYNGKDEQQLIRSLYDSPNSRIIVTSIFKRYTLLLINEIFSGFGDFRTFNQFGKLQTYSAFDEACDDEIVEYFRSVVSARCSNGFNFNEKSIGNIFKYILKMGVSDDNGVSIMFYSQNTHRIFLPVYNLLCNYIEQNDDVTMQLINRIGNNVDECLKQCNKVLIYPKYDEEDRKENIFIRVMTEPIRESYRVGARQLQEWLKNKLIPILDKRKKHLRK